MKTRDKKVDIRMLEIEVSKIENDTVREVLEEMIAVLKKHEGEIRHIFDYAEGVR